MKIKADDKEFELYISSDELHQRIKEIGQQLSQQFKEEKPLLLGILNGSFMFMADISRTLDFELEIEFVKLSSYSGDSSTGQVNHEISLKKSVEGRTIIIVEDIIDTGLTIYNFIETLKSKNPKTVYLVALLSKPVAHQFPIHIDLVGFEIPNEFVVGYGLDYNGFGRNYDAIYKVC
jgi:hypoxanthine phosphoribosyltransferase